MSFHLDVVSPEFPCGAAWLANCLLELGIPIGELWGFDTRAEWSLEDDGTHRYAAQHLPWRQTLASLRLGRTFDFQARHVTRFTHAFPWQLAFAPNIVWMVRDPRDALYSDWQRQLRNRDVPDSLGFPEFVRQPFRGGPISNADMLWLHLACWLHEWETQPVRVLRFRFEDWKQAPAAALSEVLRRSTIETSKTALAEAVQASDVGHLLAIESEVATTTRESRQFNRRGQPYEWMQCWLPEWQHALGPHWRSLLERLGYPPPGRAIGPLPDFDTSRVLAWRELTEPAEVALWEQRIRNSQQL